MSHTYPSRINVVASVLQLFFYSLVVLAFIGLQISPNIVKRDLFNYIAISFLIIAVSVGYSVEIFDFYEYQNI